MNREYDIIVIGAGHAGCEAAHAAATMGSKVILITMNMEICERVCWHLMAVVFWMLMATRKH